MGWTSTTEPKRAHSAPNGRERRGVDVQRYSLEALARELLERTATSGGGHTVDTVVGGHERVLRQTVIALIQGANLAEHENPAKATLLVLRGAGAVERRRGGLLFVPDTHHSLQALEDSAVLLTVAKLSDGPSFVAQPPPPDS